MVLFIEKPSHSNTFHISALILTDFSGSKIKDIMTVGLVMKIRQ
jgi:hypothetical protein